MFGHFSTSWMKPLKCAKFVWSLHLVKTGSQDIKLKSQKVAFVVTAHWVKEIKPM